jgi:hypothetical protein
MDMLDVMKNMHTIDILLPTMTKGIIVCIPKTPHPATPEECRLLTLLNSDVRNLARVLANRMRPFLPDVLARVNMVEGVITQFWMY